MPAGFPSATNTFIPSLAASKSLITGFSRNTRTFAVPRYCQYINASKKLGLYLVWTSQQGARILTNDDAEHIWIDGDAVPIGPVETFKSESFMTTRRSYSFYLGRQAVDQADFELLAAESAVSAQQAMTARAMLVVRALQTANWGSNTAAVNGGILPSGQTWATGSVGYSSNPGPNIKKSLQYGSLVVQQQTIGAVRPDQLSLVVNPRTAMMMASSTEIQDYMKQSEFAARMLRGGDRQLNSNYNLPDVLYDHPVVVEDTVRISSNIGASVVDRDYVLPDGEAYLVARDGELEGIQGHRSFSTIQIFFFENELTVRTAYDGINERYLGQVVTDYDVKVVAPQAGFRFTAVGTPADELNP